LLNEAFGDPFETLPLLQVAHKQVGNNGNLRWFQAHSCRITRTGRIDPEAVRPTCPGKQPTRLILLSSPSSHALGDQTAFILSHPSTDLEQELIMRILAHRSIHKLQLASCLLKFFHQQHLMHVIASQTVRGSNDHSIKGAAADLIT
jgi:hypothetical protein